jgi:hypothetical protein
MEEFRGLTEEMYQDIVAIVDDRLRQVRVTREGFERLEGAIARSAEAQTPTEATLQRTDEALQQLTLQVGGLSETVWGRC